MNINTKQKVLKTEKGISGKCVYSTGGQFSTPFTFSLISHKSLNMTPKNRAAFLLSYWSLT